MNLIFSLVTLILIGISNAKPLTSVQNLKASNAMQSNLEFFSIQKSIFKMF